MLGWYAAAVLYWLGVVMTGGALSMSGRRTMHPALGLLWPLMAAFAAFMWFKQTGRRRGGRLPPASGEE